MQAAADINQAGVKNVNVEFRTGTPDSKTLSGLDNSHTTVLRVQDPSEKSTPTKATEKVLGGNAYGQSEKTTNVIHIYTDEGTNDVEISNVVKHEELHQAGESFLSDYTSKEPGNIMDPDSYDRKLTTDFLEFNADQMQELRDYFNKDQENDRNGGSGPSCESCLPSK